MLLGGTTDQLPTLCLRACFVEPTPTALFGLGKAIKSRRFQASQATAAGTGGGTAGAAVAEGVMPG